MQLDKKKEKSRFSYLNNYAFIRKYERKFHKNGGRFKKKQI